MCLLHENTFIVNELSVNQERVKSIDPTYSGGIHLRFRNQPKPTEIDPAEKLTQVLLGGMCATTIHTKGVLYVQENLPLFPYDASHLDSNGADIDYEYAKKYMYQVADIVNVERVRALWSVFNFTFNFLLDETVWSALSDLANQLYSKEDQTLTTEEIYQIMTANGFLNYISLERDKFFNGRYPIDASKLRLQ
jgi:hypothetical protein